MEPDECPCTLTVFGRPLKNFDLNTRNFWRVHLAEFDNCEECQTYSEARELDDRWRKQRNRLIVFDTVGPV